MSLDNDVIVYDEFEDFKDKEIAKAVKRILVRLGSPTVEVHTATENIVLFLEEATEKMRCYCTDGNRKSGYFEVVDGVCKLPFNARDIIDVYPNKPASSIGLVEDYLFQSINGAHFSWSYKDRKSIFCKGVSKAYVVWVDYDKFSYEDLSEYYKSLAFRWALALTKESEANIRGKYEFGNSPFTSNASDLKSEAESEKSEIEELLNEQPLLKSSTIQQF